MQPIRLQPHRLPHPVDGLVLRRPARRVSLGEGPAPDPVPGRLSRALQRTCRRRSASPASSASTTGPRPPASHAQFMSAALGGAARGGRAPRSRPTASTSTTSTAPTFPTATPPSARCLRAVSTSSTTTWTCARTCRSSASRPRPSREPAAPRTRYSFPSTPASPTRTSRRVADRVRRALLTGPRGAHAGGRADSAMNLAEWTGPARLPGRLRGHRDRGRGRLRGRDRARADGPSRRARGLRGRRPRRLRIGDQLYFYLLRGRLRHWLDRFPTWSRRRDRIIARVRDATPLP